MKVEMYEKIQTLSDNLTLKSFNIYTVSLRVRS